MKVKYRFFDILKLYFSDYLPLIGIQTLFWIIGDQFDSDDYIELKDIKSLVIAVTLALFMLSITYFVLCNFTPLRDKSSPKILHEGIFPCLASVFAFYIFSKLFLIDVCNEQSWNYKTVNIISLFVYAIISGLIYTFISGCIKQHRLKKINEKLDNMNKY